MFVIRIRRSHLRAVIAATMLAGAFGVGTALATHEVDTIQACVAQNGSLRVVSAASDCRKNERAVEWSSEGGIAIPQTCPAGEFVTGINGDGHLICSATTGGGGGGDGDVCGDGVVGPSEACDDGGNTSTCDSDCTFSACGDGLINQAAGEQCDDGNSVAGDGCSQACKLESSP